MERKWRLYLDTSVFGGCFDTVQKWAEDSRRVMDYFIKGRATLISSEILENELATAHAAVRNMFLSIPDSAIEKFNVGTEVDNLAHAYITAGVISGRWLEDCQHVAIATVARADAIVSWNFKHIVRLNRIKGYNQVNLMSGYGLITVVSPKEVTFDE